MSNYEIGTILEIVCLLMVAVSHFGIYIRQVNMRGDK